MKEKTQERIERLEQVSLHHIQLNRLFSARADRLEKRVDQAENTAKQKTKTN